MFPVPIKRATHLRISFSFTVFSIMVKSLIAKSLRLLCSMRYLSGVAHAYGLFQPPPDRVLGELLVGTVSRNAGLLKTAVPKNRFCYVITCMFVGWMFGRTCGGSDGCDAL